jgi:hypothetical protein
MISYFLQSRHRQITSTDEENGLQDTHSDRDQDLEISSQRFGVKKESTKEKT